MLFLKGELGPSFSSLISFLISSSENYAVSAPNTIYCLSLCHMMLSIALLISVSTNDFLKNLLIVADEMFSSFVKSSKLLTTLLKDESRDSSNSSISDSSSVAFRSFLLSNF